MTQEGRGAQTMSKTNTGPDKGNGTKPKVAARVYSLEPQQVPDSPEIEEGTIAVFLRKY